MANTKKIKINDYYNMKKVIQFIVFAIVACGILIFPSCRKNELKVTVSEQTHKNLINFRTRPKFDSTDNIIQPDSFTIRFNILDPRNQNRKVRLNDLSKIVFEVKEFEGDVQHKEPEYIPNSLVMLQGEGDQPVIPKELTVSLLIDRSGSIQEKDMELIKQAVKSFIDLLPKGSVFFSTFHNDVSSSIPIDTDSFGNADFSKGINTDLNNAILIKLHEFDKLKINENAELEPGYEKQPKIYERAKRDSLNNYLIVLTDGSNDIAGIPKYKKDEYKEVDDSTLIREIRRYRNKVNVFTIGYGETTKYFNLPMLKKICSASGNPGGFYKGGSEEILKIFKTDMVNEITVDYEAKFKIPPNKKYSGGKRELQIKLIDPVLQMQAEGITNYTLGDGYTPITTGDTTSKGKKILLGLLYGFIFLLVVVILIQLIWPLIRNKIFSIRYVKKYKSSQNEVTRTCPYCFDEINESDRVVVKCEHLVHKDCWVKAGYMCPEYGQNCNMGKQDYFDIQDPFSTRNKTFYLNWVLFGLLGGLLTWLIHFLLKDYTIFNEFSKSLVQWIVPESNEERMYFIGKISPWFVIGILSGFFLSLLFAYAEEYRRLSWPVFGRIILRGIIGAFVGFVSIFLGVLCVLVFNDPYTNIWIDWIPWLIFGGAIGYSLSVKTTIIWKHGVIGGFISILFSFIMLYAMSGEFGIFTMVISFMFFGAGLGISIATVRSTSEHYFLKILNGTRQGNLIAIHKWMSALGGLNDVYIGKSNVCEIQMNWEKAHDVGDRHAKMYLNKARKIPVLVSLMKGKSTMYDERIEMMTGKEYDLVNGVTFKIGETIFQYIEKDN
jgi:hypothetical protein